MQHEDKPAPKKNLYNIEITKDLTIPKLFLKKAGKYSEDRVAMREKEFGIWRPITWKDYFENVKYITLGLIHLGL
jgi:long-chain acyl-CoA synthetase